MKYYLNCWKKYAVFSGRARRAEYWMFVLFNILIFFVLQFVLGVIIGLAAVASGNKTPDEGLVTLTGALVGIYALAALLPGLAVFVRRMHDTGRSGWNFLWVFLPIIGGIVLLVFACTDSQPGSNKYGPNPKKGGIPPTL
jgi:uncharacterized membrane protein YhaH (DUF805 family)